ncbi:MAG: CDP-alcohol phosphatidyltransferase [Piscirickettsiaceae bacterium]|nr:MAG: CDP-alcohol phosphatidyltransferase [Piscirickettsiaceae bacterium]
MTKKDIPNAISLLRIVSVIPIVYFLLNKQFTVSLILFIVAGLSDALDGYLAKKYHWVSRLGSFLDPLADKLLLVSCFLVCVLIELVPVWLFAIILIRDVVVAFGALACHFMVEKFRGNPPFSSKLNTALQILFLVMIIAAQSLVNIPETWLTFVLYSVAATTAVSGFEYIWVWGFKYWDMQKTHGERDE